MNLIIRALKVCFESLLYNEKLEQMLLYNKIYHTLAIQYYLGISNTTLNEFFYPLY